MLHIESEHCPDSGKALLAASFSAHQEIVQQTLVHCADDLQMLLSVCERQVRMGHKLLLFGNGGSAADAQHLATELTVQYQKQRAPIAALALTTDTSALTACANDFSFDEVFSRQVEALGQPGDVAIGISTSGNSENVIRALRQATAHGLIAAALSGGTGGKLVGLAEPLVIVPSTVTARIQEMHILMGHILCEHLELALR